MRLESQMIKSLKKLKIWSRRKKKKKTHVLESVPQPPTTHCCSCSAARPSAPPLPPWLDEQIHNSASASGVFPVSTSDYYRPEAQFSYPEIVSVSEITPLSAPLPVTTPSYQQYTVSSPVYGVPVVPVTPRPKYAGFFGCVVSVGTNLIRCFCPCFRFRNLMAQRR